jgi:hypothetical protein
MIFENKRISFKPKSLLEDIDLQNKLLERKRRVVDSYRPHELDFIDIYPLKEIEGDLNEIKNYKLFWEKKDAKEKKFDNISSIYEGIISDQIGSNSWFGDNCEAIPTSEYDDIKNGIDVVTIFNQDESRQYMGLGIDVTFASEKKFLEKKLESIKQCIRSRTLPSLKYFQDPETGEHKTIFLPKVIIGSRLSSAEKLIRLWGSKDEDRNKKLSEHPVSSKIILESISQLKYFYDYAYNLSENSKDMQDKEEYKKIAVEYGKMYNIFYDIYMIKKDTIESHLNEISDDIVYETIIDYTNKT